MKAGRSISAYIRVLSLVIVICSFYIQSFASDNYPVLGIQGGYTHISGYYENKLAGGPSVGFYIYPYIWKYLVIELDNDFSYFPIKDTEHSYVFSYTFSAGPQVHYLATEHFGLYAGTFITTSVFYADARETAKKSSSFKVGFSLSGGFSFPIKQGFGIRAGYVFSENDLSRKLFISHSVRLGCYYAFEGKEKKGIDDSDDYSQLKNYYSEAEAAFDNGDYDAALNLYKKVNKFDSDYADTKKRITYIKKSIEIYNDAFRLKEQGQYFLALKKLRSMETGLNRSIILMDELSKKLRPQVPDMLTEGIRLYEEKEYKNAIEIFENILIIEPDNKDAGVFLNRVKKEFNTLKRLQ